MFFFLLVQLFSRDHLDIFFFVENFAIRNICLNDFFEVAESACLNNSIEEVVGNLMIIIFGERVDDFSLL